MRKLLLLSSLLLLGAWVHAQRITGISTLYSDSFREWIIFTAWEGQEGQLVLRFPGNAGWDDWTYRLGEEVGRIRPRWPDRYDEWEIRGNGVTATARPVFPRDPRQWRLSSPQFQFQWGSRYGNFSEEWVTGERAPGYLSMYTSYEGDPRDWIIIDELDPAVSFSEKLLLIFIALWQSTPHE